MYWNTVSPLLRNVLEATMQSQVFESFRVVGGTALSLQLGHRMSVDIDLFTDAVKSCDADHRSCDVDHLRTGIHFL